MLSISQDSAYFYNYSSVYNDSSTTTEGNIELSQGISVDNIESEFTHHTQQSTNMQIPNNSTPDLNNNIPEPNIAYSQYYNVPNHSSTLIDNTR